MRRNLSWIEGTPRFVLKLMEGNLLFCNIVNTAQLSGDQLKTVRTNCALVNYSIQLMYLGWGGHPAFVHNSVQLS